MTTHLFHFDHLSPSINTPFGERRDATENNFPVLQGMALSVLTLEKDGVREPHWHPNANELSYCVQGKALLTLFSPGNNHDTFILEPGDMAFIPLGVIHHIANVGEEPLKMVLCFNHSAPEDLELSASVGSMAPHILGATFSKEGSFFKSFTLNQSPIYMVSQKFEGVLEGAWKTNRYKYDLEGHQPQLISKGGYVHMSNAFLFPVLRGLGLYSLTLEKKGVREPHWHPNAAELNMLLEGEAKITLVSPKGHVETFSMKQNDISYMPQGYFHHIETLGDSPAKFLVFFNNEYPSDIGLSGCFGAYPLPLLSELFKVPIDYLSSLPNYQQDLLIVGGG